MIPLRRMPPALLTAALMIAGTACGSASPSAATIKFVKASPASQTTVGGDPATTVTTGTSEGGPGNDPSSTVSTGEVHYGDTVKVDRSEFEKELKALNDNQQLQAASGGNGLSGAGKKTVDPRLAAGWLTAVIYDKLITHEFDLRHLKVTDGDTDAAKSQLATQFGSPEVANAFPKWFQERLVSRNARAVALRAALSGINLSDESVRQYYDSHKADFSQNCVSHILVKTKPEADSVLARLKAGEDFAAVARQTSIDTGSGAKGGDLGCNPKGVFVPEFDKAASELPVGQLSDPVQTQYGFHIILVKERKDESFDSAKEQARAALNAETQSAFRDFLAAAVTNVRVSVDRRYGSFGPPALGQAPEVVPPVAPKPNSERTDNVPTTEPAPGEAPGR